MVNTDRIPHALLLAGPPGIGKYRIARALAAYINCENRHDDDSCGVCPACRRFAAGSDPDVHEVFPIYKLKSSGKTLAEDYREEWARFIKKSPYMDFALWMELMKAGNSQPQISVEQSDRISAEAAVSAYSNRYKIFLIWLPEKMGLQAANKLLKVIEEPFADTLFICVSNDPGSILPTIHSRLRRVDFRKPDSSEVSQALLQSGVSPASSQAIARIAEGSLQKAFALASDAGETQEFFGYFASAMRAAYARMANALKEYSETFSAMGREKELRLLDYFARMTRENFIANLCTPPLNAMTLDEEKFSSRFSPFINAANAELIINEIDSAKRDISRNGNGKLIWFDFLLRLMMLLRMK